MIDRSKVVIELKEEEQIEVEMTESVFALEEPAFHVLRHLPVALPSVLPHLPPFQERRKDSYR